LCINQIDEAEKNKQVAMMGEIYSRASRVLIWLGRLDNVGSDSLIELSKRSKYINTRYGTISAKDLIGKITPYELRRYLLSRESFDSWNPRCGIPPRIGANTAKPVLETEMDHSRGLAFRPQRLHNNARRDDPDHAGSPWDILIFSLGLAMRFINLNSSST
jgi:hypothetical protein